MWRRERSPQRQRKARREISPVHNQTVVVWNYIILCGEKFFMGGGGGGGGTRKKNHLIKKKVKGIIKLKK